MKKSKSRYFSLIIGAALVVCLYLWSSVYRNASANPVSGEGQISALDVGQADATLINLSAGVQILVDCGRDAGASEAIAQRMPAADRKIEYVVLSHPDADHIGGCESVLASYEVGELIETKFEGETELGGKLQKKAQERGVKERVVKKSDRIDFSEQASGLVLWPDERAAGSMSTNDRSLVIRLDYKGGRVMLTGDAEVKAQSGILADFSAEELSSGILKVPHHGSSGALNKKFLEEVRPSYAIISVGKNNRYGHPAQAVLTALQTLGAEVLRTDEKGTIDFVYQGGWTVRK